MPVSSINFLGSRSANAGASRWIAHRSDAVIAEASVSSGSPSTVEKCPRTPSPTGTGIGAPEFRTAAPRIRPSVGFSAIARIDESPMCWATSHVIVVVSPPIVTSTVSALLISGSWLGGNSTSTTGPITRTTRPSACPFCSAIGLTLPSVARGRRQRFGAAHDLHDLGRDLVLTRAVGLPRQDLQQLVRVVGGRLHRTPARRVLRRRRFEQGRPYLRDEVLGQQVIEDLLRLRLEEVFGAHGGVRRAGHLVGCDREEPLVRRALRERRPEIGVRAPEFVDPLLGERADQGAADLLGLLVDRHLAEPLPSLLDRDAAEPEVPDALLADDVQDRLEAARADITDDRLGLLEHVGAVGAGETAIGRQREDAHAARLGSIGEQVVLHRGGVGRKVLHRPGQLLGVRTRLLDTLLRLDDPGGRDQLHRPGDLLGRLDRADPSADDAELGAHRYAGASSPAASSSTDDIRSQPTSGFTSSGGVPCPSPASDPAAACIGWKTSANVPRASLSVASCSSERSPVDRIAEKISGCRASRYSQNSDAKRLASDGGYASM